MTTAIVGMGWVGTFMKQLFPNSVVYNRNTQNRTEVNACDVTFICVPTPCINEGKLDTSIVEEVISWCKSDLIVVRSTVNPGDCDKWTEKYHKQIVMQPEYLGETPAHPMLDPKTRQFLVIGGYPQFRRILINLYTTVYNANITIRQVSLLEAEIIKLTENRAIGFKVAQCQELYDVCEKANVDYYTIREAVFGDDPRMSLWWTMIYPNNRGFNSKCIPKDIYAWCAWAESVKYDPKITRAILERNKKWLNSR
jgi:UDPglucose 6-dehydrogenase